MKSDCLESDEVGPVGDSRRNGSCPRRIVGDHESVTPESVINRAIDETRFINFELQGRAEKDK